MIIDEMMQTILRELKFVTN